MEVEVEDVDSTNCFGKNKFLISSLTKKNCGKKFPLKYSTELKRFALLLHFHSCKAYDFVHKEFTTIVSHLRTWSKQYTKTDASPGFTEESLRKMAINVDSNILSSFENISSKVPFCNIDFNLPKSPLDVDDDFEDLDTVLCELVRNQYLKRLHETLLNNLDVTSSYKKKPFNQIQHCVNLCMAELEKQALRRCMIAKMYCKGMTNMINEVKTCTKNSMIYDLLKQIIESNNKIPICDEYFKAENITNKSKGIDVSVNTEEKCNKTTSTQTEIWTDPDNNLINNCPVNTFSTNLVNKPNLPHSSFNVKSEILESNIFNNLNSLLKPSFSSNSSSDAHMEVKYMYESSEFKNLQRKDEQENSTTNDILSINALLRDLQDSSESEHEQKYSDPPEPDLKPESDSDSSESGSKSESEYEQEYSKLEEHLIENNKSSKNSTELTKPINIEPCIVRPNKISETLSNKLKSERVAKSYEFQKSMKKLSRRLQKRLNQKFNYLFETSHSYELDPLSEEEERIIVHKRIAKMVVEVMTPYYTSRRINNKNVFKSLARLISKNLMNRTYDQDERTVAREVGKYFTGNRCIKTVEDFCIKY